MRAPSLRLQLGAVFLVPLGFVVFAAIEGIIGNRADAWLVPVFGVLISKTITIKIVYFLLIAIGSLFLPCSLIIQYRAALKISSNLIKIDDRLFRSIALLYDANQGITEKDNICQQVTQGIFQGIFEIPGFHQNCGFAIYKPETSKQYLTTWIRFSKPNEPDPNLSFYIGSTRTIGSPSGGRGVAGATFIDGETRVVHFDENGKALDSSEYFVSEYGSAGRYRSMMCVAILSEELSKGKLGVLCIYSRQFGTFNPAAKEFFTAIALRLSVLLEKLP